MIRRVTLTLTGLPPTPEEIESFIADNRPDAYERVVDRLLANPRFGENQARYWLDAVRYADTHGLHIDNERSIFPYRDWVVRAYNEDLPYNEFVTWQIAGDLLPNATTEQKIATGYVRLNPTTNEGGAIEAEFLAKNTMDRVDTTSTVFLGITLQCAKCHDHKYDPFSQKDYYSLYAFLDSTADSPLDGNQRLHEPVMKAPSPEQASAEGALESELKSDEAKVAIPDARAWAIKASGDLPMVGAWQVSGPYQEKSFDAAFDAEFDPEKGAGTWRPIDFKLETPTKNIVGKENAAAYLKADITVGNPVKVDLTLSSDDGIKVWLNGNLVHRNKIFRSVNESQDLVSVNLQPGANHLLIKIINATAEDGAFVGLGGPNANQIREALKVAQSASISPEAESTLRRTFLELGPESEDAKAYRALEGKYKTIDTAVPMTYVAKELPMARPTFLLKRGQYDQPGDKVTRAIPAVFGSIPAGEPQNRLGLAEWIVEPEESADRAGDGQPNLAATLWPGVGEDKRRLWKPWRLAQPSGTARLSGHDLR